MLYAKYMCPTIYRCYGASCSKTSLAIWSPLVALIPAEKLSTIYDFITPGIVEQYPPTCLNRFITLAICCTAML